MYWEDSGRTVGGQVGGQWEDRWEDGGRTVGGQWEDGGRTVLPYHIPPRTL